MDLTNPQTYLLFLLSWFDYHAIDIVDQSDSLQNILTA